jgi:hypothetical protein
MEQLYGAMNAPPPLPPPRRRGVRAVLAGAVLMVVLGVLGVGSALAASPSPSRSTAGSGAAASGSPAPSHVCDRSTSPASSSS